MAMLCNAVIQYCDWVDFMRQKKVSYFLACVTMTKYEHCPTVKRPGLKPRVKYAYHFGFVLAIQDYIAPNPDKPEEIRVKITLPCRKTFAILLRILQIRA